MAGSDQPKNEQQSWPVSAMVALGSLIVVAAVFVWVFHQQQKILLDVQAASNQSQQLQKEMQSQFMAMAENLEQERRNEKGFMVKQQYYADLMGLLSEVYVNTTRQDITALEETLHRINQAYFGLEPFLKGAMRDWMARQIKAMGGLSNKLADPSQEYEENLLANKSSLRQMIDETHQKLYPALFAAEGSVNASE